MNSEKRYFEKDLSVNRLIYGVTHRWETTNMLQPKNNKSFDWVSNWTKNAENNGTSIYIPLPLFSKGKYRKNWGENKECPVFWRIFYLPLPLVLYG